MRSPEEIKRELVQQWLDYADEDIGLAEHLVSESAAYPRAIGFHCQQAAEKFLKALLTRHQVEFPKTHDLGQLLDLVAAVEPQLAQSLSEVIALNPYGVAARYPGDAPGITADEASSAVLLAGTVRERIRAALDQYL